ncbi:RagB/SusD family nutrient uptake outer membrane protein [uncultured Mucilaginibacter sp.]|uniref:RagB/SusD family nutrient uptake outer membrane protein n=1 Tax=uncultured Mucilaginibacter sp. TaxID=797541 RepID=UPI0025E995D8|nr:RagB/SusD family nutrient uptake outer membrane protein [uncultured Mucilaginibacter sp.]
MKKVFLYISAIVAFSSCSKILEQPDPTGVPPEVVFATEQAATLYVNDLYFRSMPLNGFGLNAAFTEETPTTSATSADGVYMYGTLGVDAVGNPFSLATYGRIRNINIGLQEVQNSALDQGAKDRLMGQMYFIRAWEYFQLVRIYGGVPFILTVGDPFNDSFELPRKKTSESFELIVSDLDNAIQMLSPIMNDSERGRVTKPAAAAFKARVLLYWASPQYNNNNDPARWQRAYDASTQARIICQAAGRDLNPTFTNIWLQENTSTNKELIFVRPFEFNATITNSWENTARPREVGSNGGSINPTVELMEAFPMKDGTPFIAPGTAKPAYENNSVLFFKDRDPRFYVTIVYNGADYPLTGLNPGTITNASNPRGNRQWQYGYYANANSTAVTQLETNPTLTGFYTRKMINPSTTQTLVTQSGTDWVEIRYAEVLLNLAECANEIGQLAEARTLVGLIRARAGITAANNYGITAATKDEMRAAILNERLCEFAYEDKRYWDIRRHNQYAQDLPGNPYGSSTTIYNPFAKKNGSQRTGLSFTLKKEYRNADFIKIRETIDLNTSFYTYFTVSPRINREAGTVNYRQTNSPSAGNPSYNFLPIQTTLLNRSPGVLQTQGWAASNTFNPFE